MPYLNLKGLDDKLMRQLKIAAIKAGKTRRDFIIEILTKAVAGKES